MYLYKFGTFDWESHTDVLFGSETPISKDQLKQMMREIFTKCILDDTRESHEKLKNTEDYRGEHFCADDAFNWLEGRKTRRIEAELIQRGYKIIVPDDQIYIWDFSSSYGPDEVHGDDTFELQQDIYNDVLKQLEIEGIPIFNWNRGKKD